MCQNEVIMEMAAPETDDPTPNKMCLECTNPFEIVLRDIYINNSTDLF
jgi:hypothetical protein